jgi:hypothetical protein
MNLGCDAICGKAVPVNSNIIDSTQIYSSPVFFLLVSHMVNKRSRSLRFALIYLFVREVELLGNEEVTITMMGSQFKANVFYTMSIDQGELEVLIGLHIVSIYMGSIFHQYDIVLLVMSSMDLIGQLGLCLIYNNYHIVTGAIVSRAVESLVLNYLDFVELASYNRSHVFATLLRNFIGLNTASTGVKEVFTRDDSYDWLIVS